MEQVLSDPDVAGEAVELHDDHRARGRSRSSKRRGELWPAVECVASAETTGRTGVEMEALTAVAAALLTIYDMCKAVDRGMRLERIQLQEKTGGKSGRWAAGGRGRSQ